MRQALRCMYFPGLNHSGSGSWVLHRGADLVGPAFCALPRSEQLRRPGAWRAHPHVCVGGVVSSSLSQLLIFLGVQCACFLRCAVCLCWGADLWLRPSWQMSTIQNSKKSWFAMKPACSLVEDASLGPQLPPYGSGCPICLSLAGGWAGPKPASSAQSFVL